MGSLEWHHPEGVQRRCKDKQQHISGCMLIQKDSSCVTQCCAMGVGRPQSMAFGDGGGLFGVTSEMGQSP